MALVTVQRSPTPSAASSAGSRTSGATASSGTCTDFGSEDDRKLNRSLSESFFMVKGAALFLQQGGSSHCQKAQPNHQYAGDLPQHLQIMINILRSEDRIKLAVRLESTLSDRVRYMVVVYTSSHQGTEENILLGMDFISKESKNCSIGMVLPLWSDTKIHLDGDGGFSVNTASRSHVFKPVSVQAMWSALQVLHKACEVSRRYNYFPGGLSLTWTSYYESCIASEQSCINEWNAMQDLESTRPDSPALFADRPTERERTECLIRAKLRSIMMFQDLENVTSKEIRNELENHMNCNLKEYKEFIDNEMLFILGQMDKATLIFDHLYLGSEWNASNLEELQDAGVGYILNVTREIDNFFPGTFLYHNIRVYDEEATDLLSHWNDTYNFIVRAKKNQSKCLVHCKMGVSRSASTVIAYAMKEYGWSLEKAYGFVKQKRSIACPNAGFMKQLTEYEGILDASKQRHNKLWRPSPAGDALEGPQKVQCGSTNGSDDTARDPTSGDSGSGRSADQEKDAADPPNYNYYFRRLSDSALDCEPPSLGAQGVFIEVEDVERDALLDDGGFASRQAHSTSHRESLEELRARLEFSTVEEDAERDETSARRGRSAGNGERGRVGSCCSSLTARNSSKNENTNNSNRLSIKRCCPLGFDDSASSGKPYKVKPSYQPPGRVHKLVGADRVRRLNPARFGGIAKNLVPLHVAQALPPTVHLESYRQQLASPMNCDELTRDLHFSLDADAMDELQKEDERPEEEGCGRMAAPSAGTELTLMDLSLGADRPATPGDLTQLELSGLVRRRAERLEKLAALRPEASNLLDAMEVEAGLVEAPLKEGQGAQTNNSSTSTSSSSNVRGAPVKPDPPLGSLTLSAGDVPRAKPLPGEAELLYTLDLRNGPTGDDPTTPLLKSQRN
ncbi:protein phosphatase Slingshot homolog 1-like [Scleropages formosus]|uniref:protein phosphatase Slingshot homolog 1-like n=1 Tax=Scleropages formosus TaxID=113540 RepID=UPI0010FA6546|nr:protein phosphatase Slingshot homolog 1-like [Scleropages formosus]